MVPEIILSTSYLPPVQYCSKFLLNRKVLIDKHEIFVKQTYRNRCVIMSSNGPVSLVVPALKGSFHKVPVHALEIDYSKKWQINHLRALEAAYRSSPFFEYYIDDLKSFYKDRFRYLLELNTAFLGTIFKLTGLKESLTFADSFIPFDTMNYLDYRMAIHPKHPVSDPEFHALPYHQVFEDRFGFVENLSVVDLLFNAGPDTIKILKSTTVKIES